MITRTILVALLLAGCRLHAVNSFELARGRVEYLAGNGDAAYCEGDGVEFDCVAGGNGYRCIVAENAVACEQKPETP